MMLRETRKPHPVCVMLRDLRRAAGFTLRDIEVNMGLSSIVLGSYERGDRNPPLSKLEQVFNMFGYTVVAVPLQSGAVRLPTDMAEELRQIADQLEGKNVVSGLSSTPALIG